ncbi:hypothetical protein [Escherichia coli]|uniref:hypothetical protein n=1 Tax=Escherichia coli TaxID=562 RepID=UPI002D1E3E94|nr:hypothetical protein [Escherichia coli]
MGSCAAPSAKGDDKFITTDYLQQCQYEQFRQELDAAGELGNWEYDLDTYNHCIAVLQRYFTGNPSGLTERDARIYSHYLQTEHKRFVKLAEELAAGR